MYQGHRKNERRKRMDNKNYWIPVKAQKDNLDIDFVAVLF